MPNSARRTHAIVMGASMAGLGTARALSNHFDRVTVIERDQLLCDGKSRKGVPQGNHGHGLLPSGYRILDDYFPGMIDDIVAAGAMRGDLTGDFLWFQYGHWKLRTDIGLQGIVVSRPFLESKVCERVRALPNVTLLERHDVEEPVFDPKTRRVTGVRVTDATTKESKVLDADLVVDVTGRGSQSPKWLASWGFGTVRETSIRVDVGYTTVVLERRKNDLYGTMGQSSRVRFRSVTVSPPSSVRRAIAG